MADFCRIFNVLAKLPQVNRLRKPESLIFLVTSACNARCRHCFLWKELNTNQNELTLDEIKKISASLGKLESILISGGEPFCRKDISAVSILLAKQNKPDNILIPTNGLLPGTIEKRVREIVSAVDIRVNISVSLDGMERFHDSLRGRPGTFSKAIETAKRLSNLKQEFPNLKLKVCTVICNENIDEIEKLGEFVYDTIRPDFHTFEIVRGDPMDKNIRPPDLSKLEKLIPKILDIYRRYDLGLEFPRSLIAIATKSALLEQHLRVLKGSGPVSPCRVGKLIGVIYPNGNVALCELKEPAGNLRDYGYDFVALWNSANANRLREKYRRCVCTHSCFQMPNMIYDPKSYPRILYHMLKNLRH